MAGKLREKFDARVILLTGISQALNAELDRCEKRKAGLEKALGGLQKADPQPDRLPTEQEIREGLKGLRCLLGSGTPREKKVVLEENIVQIVVDPSGDMMLTANAWGLFSGVFPIGSNRAPGTNNR